MNLQTPFNQHLNSRQLLNKEARYLLAVSGGVDSMVLLQLLHEAGIHFEVAHANFQLRGTESDADEMLVKKTCEKKSIPCHIQRFDTLNYMETHKMGVQEAARAMRYQWMLELLNQQALSGIITAHHQDDNIETVLMNFFKGTGWTGLSGMKEKNGGIAAKLIRPLLIFSKTAIGQYAHERQLEWREDASNESNKYTRNFFRNEVLPLIKQKIPEVTSNMSNNIERFADVHDLLEETIRQKLKKWLLVKGAEQHMPVRLLKKTKGMSTILHYWLQAAGFQAAQTNEAVRLLDAETGRYIESATHRLIKNREWLLLVPHAVDAAEFVLIEEGQTAVSFNQGQLTITIGEGSIDPGTDAEEVYLDAKEITFPLMVRTYKTGDYFYPLGMAKKKKLSRFFIDQKLSLTEKEKCQVIESNKKIIWIIGRRLDDRFKITASTKSWLRIRFSSSK